MSSSNFLGRTIRNNISLYIRDGQGRDGYISYNNGGFWKDPEGINIKKIEYEHPQFLTFHSLNHSPAPFNYVRDGSGRDNYIAYNNGGLTKGYIPNFKVTLNNFLRKNNDDICYRNKKKRVLSKREISYFGILNKIQNDVVKRLYEDEKEKFVNNKGKKLLSKSIHIKKFPILNNSKSSNLLNSNKFVNENNSKLKRKQLNSSCSTIKYKKVLVRNDNYLSSRNLKIRKLPLKLNSK